MRHVFLMLGLLALSAQAQTYRIKPSPYGNGGYDVFEDKRRIAEAKPSPYGDGGYVIRSKEPRYEALQLAPAPRAPIFEPAVLVPARPAAVPVTRPAPVTTENRFRITERLDLAAAEEWGKRQDEKRAEADAKHREAEAKRKVDAIMSRHATKGLREIPESELLK